MVQGVPTASNGRAPCFTCRHGALDLPSRSLLLAVLRERCRPPRRRGRRRRACRLRRCSSMTPDVVVAADGRAIATWRWSGVKPAQGDAPAGTRLAVREPGAAEFGPERSAPNFVTPLITYSLDRVVGLDTRTRSRGRISLRARFGNSQGTFGPPRTISTYTDAGAGAVAGCPERQRWSAWIEKASRRASDRPCGDQVARPFP